MTAIELQDVFRVHSTPEGDAAALQGLTLSVPTGEIVVVLGPSGAGKSTLLRILAGLERPSAGTARVFGLDLGKLGSRRLAAYRATELGYVDQHYGRALPPELTARTIVGLAPALRGASRSARDHRADELLERVGLAALRNRRPDELSGGERQRIALCAALAHRPRLLLADEPTGELDSENAAVVYGLLGELAREHGCTTIVVSHDPESSSIADRIVRIRDGRLSEEWTNATGAETPIVVGRGGWLQLPEELLRRAGIGRLATATIADSGVLVQPMNASEAPSIESVPAGPSDTEHRVVPPPPLGHPRVAKLERVTVTYGEAAVLDEIDAEFAGGQLHALTGPSGSGKTTFLHLLAGLMLPTAGHVTIDGVDLTLLDRAGRAAVRRSTIAYVGQQVGLVGHLSALENVELALALRRAENVSEAAVSTLALVGLAERARQRVDRLSHGERARVAIARAVAARPRLLVADEPTSRLDTANSLSIAHILASLARETGAAVVCATHDPLVIDQADTEFRLSRATLE